MQLGFDKQLRPSVTRGGRDQNYILALRERSMQRPMPNTLSTVSNSPKVSYTLAGLNHPNLHH